VNSRVFHHDRALPQDDRSIWVFGSNLAGRHGMGAAKVAYLQFDARRGVGEGPTGRAYAIPTKDEHLGILPLDQIQKSVDRFIEYAHGHPHLKFFVTRVGCGLAGYDDEQIAPMFRRSPSNCSFATQWRIPLLPGSPSLSEAIARANHSRFERIAER
jgi:hypothetical protein